MTRKFQYILGIKFFTGDLKELLERCAGHFIVVPSAPTLVELPHDPAYREAVEKSDFAITDSGFMVLLWKILTGESLTRISGLKLIRGLLAGEEFKQAKASFWIMPSEEEMEMNLAWFEQKGFPVGREDCYVAPVYPKGPLADPELLRIINERKPRYVMINIGGGVQERLGYYLKKELSYPPAIICVGAAIAFITGAQANIPVWADAYWLGWLLRCFQAPGKFIPRYWRALRLVVVLARYREQSVAPGKSLRNVILIGNYENDAQESMQHYAALLQEILPQAGWQVRLLRPEPFFGRLKRSGEGIGKWLGYLDKFIFFPFVLRRHIRERKKRKDETFLVHICDHSNAIYTRWLQDVPHLVTCHDVMAIQTARGLIPGQATGWSGRLFQRWILASLKRAAYVICVSDETREDLLSLAPELKNRSRTVENALPYPYAPMPSEVAQRHLSRLGLGGSGAESPRFLLHVGGNQWYKNREGVFRIFGLLSSSFPEQGNHPLKLVMAGKPPTDALMRLVKEEKYAGENLTQRVIFLTDVSDEELCALYSTAAALLFPSFKEGFGWPIIEALACGCPVVTSDLPPMNHLGGFAAHVADPGSLFAMVTCLKELLLDGEEARLKRREAGIQHVVKYQSQIFLKAIVSTYNQLP